jgi:O-antigen/teichoic acid export membrane protein
VALASKWWFLLRQVAPPREMPDIRSCVALTRSTVTFLGINGLNAVMTSLTAILMSKFVGEAGVGLYTAARQLTVPIEVVSQSVVTSVYPTMVRSFEPSFRRLERNTERLLESLSIIVLPAVIGLYVLAEEALVFVFGGSQFAEAAVVLRIIVWTMVLRVAGKVFGLVLVASLRERLTLRILAVDAVVAVILGWILISQFGLAGAAVASLVVRLVDFVQRYVPVRRPFQSRIAFGRIVWKPFAASLCMVAFLWLVPELHVLLSAAAGAVAYFAVLFVLMIVSAGGLGRFRAKYAGLWSRR